MGSIHKTPVPGIPIICSSIPRPDDIIIGYRVVEPSKDLLCKPEPSRINGRGWASIIVLALVFWPASCIPCFTSCSYSPYQEPVYKSKE